MQKLAAACLLVAAGVPAGAAPVVTVQAEGAIVGGLASADGNIASFLGIPFAAPPVGAMRWQAPEPQALSGKVDATRYAPACMQGAHMVDWYRDLVERFDGDPATFPVPEFSEDCLYLNVWTSVPNGDAELPVMVWIHGGSHRGGWSYEPNYHGEGLARHGVVVVSIAYRLDVFGFFSHPDLDIANFGLLDQVTALQWVRAHIAAFGGDPDNVTVFGESAGAASIGWLMASPHSKGLFHRAIHQSAGYELVNTDRRGDFLDEGRRLERRVLRGAGQVGIDALRFAPAGALLEAAENAYSDYRPDVVVDGEVVTEPLAESLANGRLAGIDLMIGTNADEWLMYLDHEAIEDELAEWTARAPAVSVELARADDTAARRLDRLVAAEQFVCPSLELADAVGRSGGDVFVYYFDRVRPGKGGEQIGAYHGAELPYVFGTHDDWLPTDDIDRRLTQDVMGYWTSFARDGRPRVEGSAAWPRYTEGEPTTMILGNSLHLAAHPECALCTAMNRNDKAAPP